MTDAPDYPAVPNWGDARTGTTAAWIAFAQAHSITYPPNSTRGRIILAVQRWIIARDSPPPPVTTKAARCTHGGDCTVHPDVKALHDFTPTATEALDAVLQWAIEHEEYETQTYVREVAARHQLTLTAGQPVKAGPPRLVMTARCGMCGEWYATEQDLAAHRAQQHWQ